MTVYSYLLIIFLGIPFTILYNYLSSILRSVGEQQDTVLYFWRYLLFWTFSGFILYRAETWMCRAAITTISAQAISGILCLIFIIRKMKLLWLKKEKQDNGTRDAVKELLAMGIPTGLQFSIYRKYGYAVYEQRLGSTYVSALLQWRSSSLPCVHLMLSQPLLLYSAAKILEQDSLTG